MTHLQSNYERMFALIDETFATRNDPDQIQVTPEQHKKLQELHPSTLTELADENGPLIWVLIVPTTTAIMYDFLKKRISEKALLEETKVGDSFDCIYLCSITTLPEQRGKGETKKMCIDAIREVQKNHPIKKLFVWPFTKAGEGLAESVAKECKLELLKTSF